MVNIKISLKKLKTERKKGVLEELYAKPRLAKLVPEDIARQKKRGIRKIRIEGNTITLEEREINPIYVSNIGIDVYIDIENKRLYIEEPIYAYLYGGKEGSRWVRMKRREIEDLIGFVKRALILYAEKGAIDVEASSIEELKEYVRSLSANIDSIILNVKKNINENLARIVKYYVLRDIIGFDVLEPLVSLRKYVEDIVIAAPNTEVKVSGRFGKGTETFLANIILSSHELNSLIEKVVLSEGKSISLFSPLESLMTKRGHRVTVAYGREVTYNGPVMVIRLFAEPWNIIRLFLFDGIHPMLAAFLGKTIALKKSTLIVGVMGSGKTSLLNSLSAFIPKNSTIVTIEDTPEIRLPHKFWIRHITRTTASAEKRGEIGMFDLVKHALRESADYVIIGEVRGEEGRIWAQAIATGHGGLTTFHADSTKAAIARLTTRPIEVDPALLSALYNIATVRRTSIGRYTNAVYSLVFHEASEAASTASGPLEDVLLFHTSAREYRLGSDVSIPIFEPKFRLPGLGIEYKINYRLMKRGDRIDIVTQLGVPMQSLEPIELVSDEFSTRSEEFKKLEEFYLEALQRCAKTPDCLDKVSALKSIYETNIAEFEREIRNISKIYAYLEAIYTVLKMIKINSKLSISEISDQVNDVFDYQTSTILMWALIEAPENRAIEKMLNNFITDMVANSLSVLSGKLTLQEYLDDLVNSEYFRGIVEAYQPYLQRYA